MTNRNRKIGNSFEQEFCEILAANGFWAHNMAQNSTGQPADVIAAYHNVPILVDCKVCSNDKFDINRIEPNQEAAMMMWLNCGNKYCYFAMKLSDNNIYMVHFNQLTKSITDFTFYPDIDLWMEMVKCKYP